MTTIPSEEKAARSNRRRRGEIIPVRVDEAELEVISANAAAAQLTRSEFLRRLGHGHTPKSKVDLALVQDLCRVAGDLGRLGGLLKLWLSEKRSGSLPPHDIPLKDIDALWREVQATYGQLKEKVEAL